MPNAVIAGAGPGGAALALLLAQRGVEVTLVERHEDFAREFRGERLMPAGMELLAGLALGGGLDALPRRRIEGTEVFVDGRRRFGFSFGPEQAPTYLPQAPLLEAIVLAASDHPGFRLLRGTVVRDVVRDGGGRVVGLAVDDDSTMRTLTADLTIAADGRASTARRKAGLTLPSTTQEAYDVVWVAGPGPDEDVGSSTARMYLSRTGPMVFSLPAPDGSVQIGAVIEKGAFAELRAGDAWFDAIAEAVTPEVAHHLAVNRDRLSHTLLDVVCTHVECWSQPGLLLIGDAAHPMSPMGGQGIGMALRDAVVAANHLVPVFAEGGGAAAIEAACHRIEAERRREIDRVQQVQRRSVPMLQQRTLRSRVIARRVAPLLSRVAPGVLAKAVGGRPEMTRGVSEVVVDGPPGPVAA